MADEGFPISREVLLRTAAWAIALSEGDGEAVLGQLDSAPLLEVVMVMNLVVGLHGQDALASVIGMLVDREKRSVH